MENEIENAAYIELIPRFFAIAMVFFLIGIAVGIAVGRLISKKKKFRVSMEQFIMVLSGIFVVCSVVFQTLGKMEAFASIVVTMFSSVIFSWWLTKISSKEEWEEREQELALHSYRHIDYIESASKTAEKAIKQYIDENQEISEAQKLVLSKALDYIGYIRGGIGTCKMDWYDLMSEEGQSKFMPKESTSQTVLVDAMDMNQEDA